MTAQQTQKPSPLGKPLVLLGTLIFLHAAYSTYEHSSIAKTVGLSQSKIPLDVRVVQIANLLDNLSQITLVLLTPLRRSPYRWNLSIDDRSQFKPSYRS